MLFQACDSRKGSTTEDADSDGVVLGDGCNKHDLRIHPGAEAVCDGIVKECNGFVDDGLFATFCIDWEGDGYGSYGMNASAIKDTPKCLRIPIMMLTVIDRDQTQPTFGLGVETYLTKLFVHHNTISEVRPLPIRMGYQVVSW